MVTEMLPRRSASGHAASFYGQIRAILSGAAKKDIAEVAMWKIAKFLDDCRGEFGFDEQMIGPKEQFSLRVDDTPYLKIGKSTRASVCFASMIETASG
jgi:hypothetical protein